MPDYIYLQKHFGEIHHYYEMFTLQAGRDEEKLVIWDYHVIALYRPEEVQFIIIITIIIMILIQIIFVFIIIVTRVGCWDGRLSP